MHACCEITIKMCIPKRWNLYKEMKEGTVLISFLTLHLKKCISHLEWIKLYHLWIELNWTKKKKTHLSSLFISISTALKILDVTIKELIRFSCLISKYNPINSNFLMAQTKKFKGDEKQMKLDIKRRGVG